MDILLSTAYFPPIEYMALIAQNESVTLEVCENYVKQSYRNRCKILSSTTVQDLSIPVIKTEGNHTPITRVKISYAVDWQRNHWRSLETAYNKSPFFLYYQDELSLFFQKKYEYLLDLNQDIIAWLLKKLNLNKTIGQTEVYQKNGDFRDFRDLIHPKKETIAKTESYIQTFSETAFVPNLSVLDLLFNCGNESRQILLETQWKA